MDLHFSLPSGRRKSTFLNAQYPELEAAVSRSAFRRIWIYKICDFNSFAGEVLWMKTVV
jgi:hypothetical protein